MTGVQECLDLIAERSNGYEIQAGEMEMLDTYPIVWLLVWVPLSFFVSIWLLNYIWRTFSGGK